MHTAPVEYVNARAQYNILIIVCCKPRGGLISADEVEDAGEVVDEVEKEDKEVS